MRAEISGDPISMPQKDWSFWIKKFAVRERLEKRAMLELKNHRCPWCGEEMYYNLEPAYINLKDRLPCLTTHAWIARLHCECGAAGPRIETRRDSLGPMLLARRMRVFRQGRDQ